MGSSFVGCKKKVLIVNSKYQKSVASMFGVGKAQDIANKFRIPGVMLAFEIPVRAFSLSIDKVGNGRKQRVLFGHERWFDLPEQFQKVVDKWNFTLLTICLIGIVPSSDESGLPYL